MRIGRSHPEKRFPERANQSDPARKQLLAGSDAIAVVLFLLAGSLRRTGSAGCLRGTGDARRTRGLGRTGGTGDAGHTGSRRSLRSAVRALVCRRIDLCSALGALNGAGFDSGWSEAHIVSFLSQTTFSLCSQHLHRVFESSISAQTMHRLSHARCHAVAGNQSRTVATAHYSSRGSVGSHPTICLIPAMSPQTRCLILPHTEVRMRERTTYRRRKRSSARPPPPKPRR